MTDLFGQARGLGERAVRLGGVSCRSSADGLISAVIPTRRPVLVAPVADVGFQLRLVRAGSRRSVSGASILARSRNLGARIRRSVPFPVTFQPH